MTTKMIDIHEVQSSLPDLLSLVRKGTDIIFTDGNIQLARLSSIHRPQSSRIPGLHKGAISTSDDFDEPLSDEFWMGNQ